MYDLIHTYSIFKITADLGVGIVLGILNLESNLPGQQWSDLSPDKLLLDQPEDSPQG